ncbi:hypothetical protein SCNRRL3882_2094 [Streptomyces chartreusis NRRL 3882]|uniref:Uncharacterized protein n=1 Tax=Streptomyces chartreusis NRRL 3882 TaxID=1079985 RepID=A0A2N9B5K1_STRCX|nr:hypothetical protein SCNRRL3882_2094 [Streptomyces chartreusis NRRL 3882]
MRQQEEGGELVKKNRIRQSIMLPALGVMMAGAFTLAAGASATAAEVGATGRPSDCNVEKKSFGAIAMCKKHNGGHYRALVVCKDPESGKMMDFAGAWRKSGVSYAYCQGSYLKPVHEGHETKVS